MPCPDCGAISTEALKAAMERIWDETFYVDWPKREQTAFLKGVVVALAAVEKEFHLGGDDVD